MKRYFIRTLPFMLFLTFGCTQKPKQEKATLVLQNGTVYTVDTINIDPVSAIAIKDNKIVFVGSDEEVQDWVNENTTVVDLNGKVATPGWIEGHGHFLGLGKSKQQVDLYGVTSYEQLVEKVTEAVSRARPGDWILGRGWHQSKWDSISGQQFNGFQTHHLLSAVSPDNPVFLTHASGHAGFANAKAMQIAGVGVLSREKLSISDEHSGEVIRDDEGNPTGIFVEKSVDLIREYIPESDRERDKDAMMLAMEECLSNGITSFHDAGVSQYEIDIYNELLEAGSLKQRMYLMISNRDTSGISEWLEKGPLIGAFDDFLTIRSIKIHADGALGSRGAWLLEEYSDRPGHFGHETTPMSEVYSLSQLGLEHGFQVCTHAIGDKTNQEVLNQYEQAFSEFPDEANTARFRIEHAQHLHPDDIPRFASLNVIAAMQAIHMSSDRAWAIDRLGEKRIQEGAYVWQPLIKSGAVVINGSDTPVEPINPLASYYASVTRKQLDGYPEEGFEQEHAMTREQALESYTIKAAYGAFEEKIKGSISIGKLADITVFDRDILTIPEDQILETNVILTVLNGKIVYER